MNFTQNENGSYSPVETRESLETQLILCKREIAWHMKLIPQCVNWNAIAVHAQYAAAIHEKIIDIDNAARQKERSARGARS